MDKGVYSFQFMLLESFDNLVLIQFLRVHVLWLSVYHNRSPAYFHHTRDCFRFGSR